jgi:hypothetical protein
MSTQAQDVPSAAPNHVPADLMFNLISSFITGTDLRVDGGVTPALRVAGQGT